MRTTLAAVLACISMGPAIAADPVQFQLREAGDLVGICSVAPNDPNYANAMGLCHGILVGAFGYYQSTVTNANRFVCAPHPTPTRASVMKGFVTWARSHPANMKDPPIDTLFRYLADTYPCKS